MGFAATLGIVTKNLITGLISSEAFVLLERNGPVFDLVGLPNKFPHISPCVAPHDPISAFFVRLLHLLRRFPMRFIKSRFINLHIFFCLGYDLLTST